MALYPNNWIPTQTLEQISNINYDVLIVGTGIGGGAALYRLCQLWKNRGDKKICVLEKGDKLFHSHSLNIPTMNVFRMRAQLLIDNSTPIGFELPEFSGARQVYALGGRSLFANAWCVKPIESELKKWPIHPMELDAYFELALKSLNVTTLYTEGSSIQNVLLNRLHANGFMETSDSPLAIDMRGSHQGEIRSNAWYSTINFLAHGLNDLPYDLSLNSNVSQVIVENGRVSGVLVYSPDKKSYVIRAKNVILAASALETPRILLNSGIKGNAIGRYLTNHTYFVAYSSINKAQFGEDVGNLSILKRETEQDLYQMQIVGPNQYYSYQQYEEKILPEELSISQSLFGTVEPRAENMVYLDYSRRDEYGDPTIQVNFSYSNNDLAIVELMRQGVVRTASAMGLNDVDIPDTLRPPGEDIHESCTCRMGIDPDISATNTEGEIHGISGLYVADNSIIPILPAVGPILTTTALSMRVADIIVRKNL